MPEHDQSYKQLFCNPELVRDLLQGFVLEDWVQELDCCFASSFCWIICTLSWGRH